MNPGSGEKALDSGANDDIGRWMIKQPDPNRSRTAMEEELQMELMNIMNTADKCSSMITMPAINSGRMGSYYFAAGMNPELEMRQITASLTNTAEATSVTTMAVPRSSCGMVINNISAAGNTNSGLHRYISSPLRGDQAAAAARGLSRGSVPVKVKKKRVRPSRRVPTTVVKTDTSNFKEMVERFTGIPIPTTTTTTTQESNTSPSASTSSPQSTSTSSASSPSFTKPLPHPAVCKISSISSAPANPNTPAAAATTTCPSPLLPSSFPTCQSLPELPFISTVGSIAGSGDIPNSVDPEELTMTSLIDATFFDELWR